MEVSSLSTPKTLNSQKEEIFKDFSKLEEQAFSKMLLGIFNEYSKKKVLEESVIFLPEFINLFTGLPIYLAEFFFNTMKKAEEDYITFKALKSKLKVLKSGTEEEKIGLIFDLLDFYSCGTIDTNDLVILYNNLKHIFFQSNKRTCIEGPFFLIDLVEKPNKERKVNKETLLKEMNVHKPPFMQTSNLKKMVNFIVNVLSSYSYLIQRDNSVEKLSICKHKYSTCDAYLNNRSFKSNSNVFKHLLSPVKSEKRELRINKISTPDLFLSGKSELRNNQDLEELYSKIYIRLFHSKIEKGNVNKAKHSQSFIKSYIGIWSGVLYLFNESHLVENYSKCFLLRGCFVRNDQLIVEGKKIYQASIYLRSGIILKFFHESDIDIDDLTIIVRRESGLSNFFEDYKLTNCICKEQLNFSKSTSQVCSAINLHTCDNRVVKIISKGLNDDDTICLRSLVDTLRCVKLANAVNVEAVYENSEYIFVVLDILSNFSLNDLIKGPNKLREKSIKKLVSEILTTLKDLLTLGLYYEDLSPSNIMINLDKNDTFSSKLSIVNTFFLQGISYYKQCVKEIKAFDSDLMKRDKTRKPVKNPNLYYTVSSQVCGIMIMLYKGKDFLKNEKEFQVYCQTLTSRIVADTMQNTSCSTKSLDFMLTLVTTSKFNPQIIKKFLEHEWFRSS